MHAHAIHPKYIITLIKNEPIITQYTLTHTHLNIHTHPHVNTCINTHCTYIHEFTHI